MDIKNWKTTLAGFIGGALVSIAPLLTGDDVSLQSILSGLVVFAVAYFAKDAGVTGKKK